ncbi:MAG: DUF3794 domain-containing protein, partial [Eubacteriales bacterium]|nr:DUF3794 domain-containing protein [Eubacteriales bacterium]
MNISKTAIKTPVLSGTAAASALVEGIIKLPEGVEAQRIVGCSARMMELGATAMNEAAAVEGTVEFSVIFAGEDGALDSVTGASGFTHRLKSPGLESDMELKVQGSITSPEARITSPDRIAVEATAELEVQGERREDAQIVSTASQEQAHFHSKTIYWYEKAARRSSGLVVRDEIELPGGDPDALKVLQAQGYARVLHVQPMRGEALVSGELTLEVLYSADARPFVKTALTLPFNQTVELPEAQEDMEILCAASVSQLFVSLHEDLQGRQRLLAVEAPLELRLEGWLPRQSDVVDDAWTSDSELVLSNCSFRVQDAPIQYTTKLNVSGEAYQVDIPETVDKSVVLCGAVIDGYGMTDGRVEFNGRLKLQALYVQGDNPGSATVEVPFESAIDWDCLDSDAELAIRIGNCDAALWHNAGRWQADATMEVT